MIGGYIQINEDWRIAIEDGLNFTLQKRKVSKKLNERWVSEGYYEDLEVLCLDLRDNMIRESEDLSGTVDNLIDVVRESTNEIRVALGESPLLYGVKD